MSELRTSLLLLAVLCLSPSLLQADNPDSDAERGEKARATATHKQSMVIEVTHDGNKVPLNTFTVAKNGDLLACVTAVASRTSKPDADTEKTEGYLQAYSPEGKLLRETAVSFVPTAVSELPDGTVIVAGAGKVAKIAADGSLLTSMPSPHLGDIESLKARVAKDAEKQLADVTKRYQDMVDQVTERIEAIEKIPEEERSKRDIALMKSLPAQKKVYEKQAQSMKQTYSQVYSPESLLKRKMGITALAVTSQDIFLTCYSVEGRGYEVWRTDHDLSAPKQVVTGLGGCCGQCDVQAAGDNIVIGENTKFKVTMMDRDGNALGSFGERDRTSENGFGSCCNPMNVRCCSNGDILTSESSIGNIKRYSKDGEYLGLVGKAKIGGGCKHVAVGVDEKRNRYYTMNIDKDHICVLVPLSEAPEMTAEELAARQSIDAYGTKLFGTWEPVVAGAKEPATTTQTYSVTLPNGLTETRTRTVTSAISSYDADKFVFHADGSLDIVGGSFANYSNAWEAINHDKATLNLAHVRDGVHYYNIVVEFQKPEEATISIMSGTRPLTSKAFKRTACGEDCKKSETETDADSVTTTSAAATLN